MMRTFFSILLLFSGFTSLFAQGYRGHDFWVAFPKNAVIEDSRILHLSLFITAETRTTGTIQNMMDSSVRPFSVEGGASIEVDIDTEIELRSSALTAPKSLHITSDHDISLYVASHRLSSTDSYAAIPTGMLGTHYIAAGYTPLRNGPESFPTECGIVATEDNTLVTMHLNANINYGQSKGHTLEFPLNRGDAVQVQGSPGDLDNDLTGSSVISTKPIAFFTGHQCAEVPPNNSFCDVLLEQEPPERDWGREFILTKFQGKDYSVARVIAGEKPTNVSINGKQVASLAPYTYYEVDTFYNDAMITTTEPALVAQYCTSGSADTERKVGDPFMLFVVPNDRFIPEVTTASVVDDPFLHYLNVVVPTEAIHSLRIDGLVAGASKNLPWTTPARENLAPDKSYTVLTFEVPPGRHLLQCAKPIAVYSYGFGKQEDGYDSYGHACGMRLGK